MIFIIEGIDKSGKSTVIKDLIKEFDGAVVFKLYNKPKNSSEREREKVWIAYTELFHQATILAEEGKTVIFDRAYPSELVYSVKRGYDAFYNNDWWKMDEGLVEAVTLVYCEAPVEVLKKRFVDTQETDLDFNELEKILERYNKFIETTKLDTIVLDTTKGRKDNMRLIHEHKRRKN